MANSQGQIQVQTESQIQKLSPQQLLAIKLIELPIADLEERVKNEVIDNVALEEGRSDAHEEDSYGEADETENSGVNDDYNDTAAAEDDYRDDSASDPDIADYASIDDAPSYIANRHDTEGQEIPIGDSHSFIDDLMAQMLEYDLTEHQQDLIEYLIGSLDDNGFIDRPLSSIENELLFQLNIVTNEAELQEALGVLQQFEPVGIGARSPQECLILQIDHELKSLSGKETEGRRDILNLEKDIILNHYDMFLNKNFERLRAALGIGEGRFETVLESMRKLNPRPGRALCESADDRAQTVIPDFVIETEGDQISMWLNDGNVPELHVSKEYTEQLEAFQKNSKTARKSEREAMLYIKQKVESARTFIDSIQQRRRTLYSTMKAIVDLQREFMLTQDESSLKPMILRNVADRAHLDISTVSRVCNSKYAMINGNVYHLKQFFMRTRQNSKGEEIQGQQVISALRAVVDGEDKSEPFSDLQLVDRLKEKGLDISRRTVAKYRKAIGIPVAKDRKV